MFFLNGLAVVSWIAGVIATSSNGNVRSTTTCNCVNQNITYECTVVGGAFTVWSGSAFMCRGREITLTHLSFTGSIGECNDGAIIAQGVRVDGNSYTSRLTVTLSPELIGTSVNCSVDTTTDLIPIGNYTLRLSSGADSFPPPRSVFLSRVGQSEISFSWSNVQHKGCPVFQYDIYSVNCGTCSSESLVATSNSTICVDFNSILLSANNTCNFTVWSVICGDIAGDSRYTTVTLKVPDPPDIEIVPAYLNETSQLSKITTTFIEVDSFNISVYPLIHGSASFYTILYTDSVSGSICDTATIMPSSCINRRCNHTFIMSSSTCSVSANITVSGFATNMLGNGRHSTPVRIDRVNRYVNVTFDPTTRRVLCQFLNPMSTNSSKCKADLKYGPSCDQEIGMYSNSSTSDSVMTPQLDFTDEVLEYCLFVTAVDDTITVTVARTLLNIGQNVHHQVSFTWIAVLVVIVILVLLIILIIVILCMCKYVCPQVKNIAFLKPANLNLSVALKVFEDNGIEDLCVSIDSLHWKVRSTSPRESATFNYIHYKSSQEQLPGSEELEKGIYKFAVAQNDPKQFIKCLETLEKFDIRILGITNLNEGEVALECKCKCTRKTKQNIIRGLRSKDCKVESSRDEYPLLPFSYLNLNCYTNAKGVTAK